MPEKIFVVFLQYNEKVHRYKDPGIIAELLSQSHEVKIMSSQVNQSPLCINLSENEIYQGGWIPEDKQCAIVIFHGGKPFCHLIQKAKKMGHKVIIKADTDGHLVRKLWNPFSDEMYGVLRSSHINLKPLFKHWLRLLDLPRWARNRGLYEVDYIILESMNAYKIFLKAFPELVDKLVMLPNGAFFKEKDEISLSKENQVIAVGRWDDSEQKNPELLFKVINIVAQQKLDWKFVIIGKYDDHVQTLYDKLDRRVRDTVQLMGAIEYNQTLEYMKRSKIILNTSRWEGFPMSGIEALSQGCSIACTPTGMSMQTGDGLLGNCTIGSNPHDLAQAVMLEMRFWEMSIRNSEEIRNTAKNLYNWDSIAKKLRFLCS